MTDLSRFVLTNTTKRLTYEEAAIEVMDCLCFGPECEVCGQPVQLVPVASVDNNIDVLRICRCPFKVYAKYPKKARVS